MSLYMWKVTVKMTWDSTVYRTPSNFPHKHTWWKKNDPWALVHPTMSDECRVYNSSPSLSLLIAPYVLSLVPSLHNLVFPSILCILLHAELGWPWVPWHVIWSNQFDYQSWQLSEKKRERRQEWWAFFFFPSLFGIIIISSRFHLRYLMPQISALFFLSLSHTLAFGIPVENGCDTSLLIGSRK